MIDSKSIITILNDIITDQDISIAAVARRMNKSSQALNAQLNNDDIKLSTMLAIVDALRCTVNITITDRATGDKHSISNDDIPGIPKPLQAPFKPD